MRAIVHYAAWFRATGVMRFLRDFICLMEQKLTLIWCKDQRQTCWLRSNAILTSGEGKSESVCMSRGGDRGVDKKRSIEVFSVEFCRSISRWPQLHRVRSPKRATCTRQPPWSNDLTFVSLKPKSWFDLVHYSREKIAWCLRHEANDAYEP